MKRRSAGNDDTTDRPGAPVVDVPPEEAGLTPAEPGADEAGPSELDSLRAERDELKDRVLRRAAEFDNYRKRVERDRAQAGLDATDALLKALIPTLDNLERALGSEAAHGGALREGVELTYRELLAALQGRGLVVEDPAGQRFDPTRHEALSHEPAPGFAEGDVVEVLRKGYSFGDRLLRPALVKVAKGDEGPSGMPREKVH